MVRASAQVHHQACPGLFISSTWPPTLLQSVHMAQKTIASQGSQTTSAFGVGLDDLQRCFPTQTILWFTCLTGGRARLGYRRKAGKRKYSHQKKGKTRTAQGCTHVFTSQEAAHFWWKHFAEVGVIHLSTSSCSFKITSAIRIPWKGEMAPVPSLCLLRRPKKCGELLHIF